MLEERDTHIEKTGLKEVAWFIALWLLGFIAILIIGSLIKFAIGT